MLILTNLKIPSIPRHIKVRTNLTTKLKTTYRMSSTEKNLKSCHFEVYGRVQGVYFRKYTREEATKLGIVGWIRNTEKGTVEGEIQGKEEDLENMKAWLSNTGSPSSKIDNAVFENERQIDSFDFDNFTQRQ